MGIAIYQLRPGPRAEIPADASQIRIENLEEPFIGIDQCVEKNAHLLYNTLL